jgi:hypothetical protein
MDKNITDVVILAVYNSVQFQWVQDLAVVGQGADVLHV